jgi:hypothetical protein
LLKRAVEDIPFLAAHPMAATSQVLHHDHHHGRAGGNGGSAG